MADVIVLAGDIHLGLMGLEWARHLAAVRPVIYVPGNHEYYGHHLFGLGVEMRKFSQEIGIHYLDNDEVIIDGVRFLGATLWTDFELFGIGNRLEALQLAKDRISDFSCVRTPTGWFTPPQSVILHRACRGWLTERLAETFCGPTVVVTHHMPTAAVIDPRHTQDLLSAAFASNLDELVQQADMWICGHTHTPTRAKIGKCHVILNPRGYPSEEPRWDPDLIVELAVSDFLKRTGKHD